jgi:DNA-binding NarL/FixJ family response regulator
MRARAELVLLDVCMPALRGDSLVPVLRQSLPHAAIVFYSALDERELALLALKLQVEGYILKTVRPSQLVRTINEVLRTRERLKTI